MARFTPGPTVAGPSAFSPPICPIAGVPAIRTGYGVEFRQSPLGRLDDGRREIGFAGRQADRQQQRVGLARLADQFGDAGDRQGALTQPVRGSEPILAARGCEFDQARRLRRQRIGRVGAEGEIRLGLDPFGDHVGDETLLFLGEQSRGDLGDRKPPARAADEVGERHRRAVDRLAVVEDAAWRDRQRRAVGAIDGEAFPAARGEGAGDVGRLIPGEPGGERGRKVERQRLALGSGDWALLAVAGAADEGNRLRRRGGRCEQRRQSRGAED